MKTVLTVDAIIKYKNQIVVIERSKLPFGLALPGGHVEENETLEQSVEREAMEETNLKLANLKQFHTYSELDRDPRYRAISTVFTADGYGELKAGSDAKNIKLVSLDDIGNLNFAFDHYRILSDYKREDYSNQVTAKTSPIQQINGKSVWEVYYASQYYDNDPRMPGTEPVDERFYVLADSIDEALGKSKSLIQKVRKYYGKQVKENEKIVAAPISLESLIPSRDSSNDGRMGWISTAYLAKVQLSLPEDQKEYKLVVSLIPKKK